MTRAGGDPLDMRLTVHAGASMPLPPAPSRLNEVSVPALALHAGGKLSLQPGGLAHRLSTQLQAAGVQLQGLREDARVLVSPTSAAYAHVAHGVMHCDRAEMLLGGDAAVMKVRIRARPHSPKQVECSSSPPHLNAPCPLRLYDPCGGGPAANMVDELSGDFGACVGIVLGASEGVFDATFAVRTRDGMGWDAGGDVGTA